MFPNGNLFITMIAKFEAARRGQFTGLYLRKMPHITLFKKMKKVQSRADTKKDFYSRKIFIHFIKSKLTCSHD